MCGSIICVFIYVQILVLYRIVLRFFFFSSRRRHTRFDCDWSSDVCSSDLKSRGKHLTKPQPRPSAEPRWVYAYKLEPLQPDARFHKIKALLGKAHVAARRAARMWASRIVVETRVSHILIVSDSPSRQRAVNRALEKELKLLGLRFVVNEPVPLPAEGP